jgi:hypothetical protein
MNREKAKEIFQAYGRPEFKVKDTVISFSRQTEEDIEIIENKSDNELVEHWKSLVFINCIMEQVSLNDLQRIDLIQLEIDERKNIDINNLDTWFKEKYTIYKNEN